MDSILRNIFITLGIIAILAITIMNYAIKGNKFTCQKYILNTYIYILLAFVIMALICFGLEYKKHNYLVSGYQFLALFLISIGFLIASMSIDRTRLVLKHLVWLAFILCIGYIFYPMYVYAKTQKVLLESLLTAILLVIFLSIAVFVKPDIVSLSIGPVLFWLLVGGIILSLVNMFFMRRNPESQYSYFRLLSYFFVGLFTVFILYDTKRLRINAQTCIEKIGADYIKESLSLFLDILNLLIRIISLKGGR